MAINVEIFSPILKALYQFTPAAAKKKQPRVDGIAVEVRNGRVFYIATDGVMLGCYSETINSDDIPPVLIPSSLINQVLKNVTKDSFVRIEVGDRDTPDMCPVTLRFPGGSVTEFGVYDDYPDWRRVVPRTVSGETAQFDPALMARIANAITAIYGPGKTARLMIAHNGTAGASLFDFGDLSFFGVIMPLRGEREVLPLPPDWVFV